MGKRQGKQSNAKLVFENIENARSGEEHQDRPCRYSFPSLFPRIAFSRIGLKKAFHFLENCPELAESCGRKGGSILPVHARPGNVQDS